MATLQEIIADHTKRDIATTPQRRRPSAKTIEDSEKAFDISTNKGVPPEQAQSEVFVSNMLNFTKELQNSPLYQDADKLVDVIDPVEAPTFEDGIADPMGELLKAELAIVKPITKGGLKIASFVFSPIERAFKFLSNATMYDPLLKSAAGPVKRWSLEAAIEFEKVEQVRRYRQDNNLEITDPIPEDVLKKIDKDVDELSAGIVKKTNAEIEEIGPVKAEDFGKSAKDAIKALVPWPGFADDVKTFGESGADSFKRITGRDAPWYYVPVSDIALETVALSGVLKLANVSQSAKLVKEGAEDAASIARAAKLTKGEIRAMRLLSKAKAKFKRAPVPSPTVPSPTEASTVTQKLIQLVKDAKPLRDKKALLLHQDRQRKSRKLVNVQKNIRGRELVSSTKKALTGTAPVPDFSPIGVNFTPQEIDALYNIVNNSQLPTGFDTGRGILTLHKLLDLGKLPTKSEVANLEVVFGRSLTKALFMKRDISSIVQDLSFEIINLPRAMLASFDLSAAGRQGIIFSVSHPIASTKAFGRSVRAAASLQYADDIERTTRLTKFGKMADNFGVHSSPTGFAAKIGAKEEAYMSRVAEKIPGIAQSERAFTTFLNQQRREVFSIQARKWIKKGITPDNNPETYRQFAKFVNHATGRGSLETLQPGALTALNATFFSPRFQVSRVQVLGDLISPKTTRHARKVIARDLAEFYATGMGILAMMEMGGAEVGKDPTSSDFGKVKVGNTRYNYWGAFQPLATLAGRMYTGKVKSTATGKTKDVPRFNINLSQRSILRDFIRTKFAPVPGLAIDSILGETVEGKPVEATKEFLSEAAFRSLTPLVIQDSIEAWKFQGADAQFPLSATLAFTGIGVQTWEVAPFAELELAKDSLSRQTYGKNYDQLSFEEVSLLDRDILVNHPGIVDLEREVRFDSESVTFQTKILLERRKSEQLLEKRVDDNIIAELNDIRLRIGAVDRIVGNWRLNDKQYKKYQELVAKNVNELFAETRPLWDTKSIEGKYELMSAILRNAKLLSANEMKIGEME